MTHQGGCFCGKVRVSIEGEPAKVILCHCGDCRKISGGLFSYNALIPDANFKAEGDTKSLPKVADSGNEITSYFCPNCGTTVYRRSPESFPGLNILKAGVLDDASWITKHAPEGELYVPSRIGWLPSVETFQK